VRTVVDYQALAEKGVTEYSFLVTSNCLLEAFGAGYDLNV
jgi:hypothetical protein